MATTSFPVYRIYTVPSQTNAYTTGRMETWSIKLDQNFSNLLEAREYVINMNRAHSDLPLFLVDLKEDQKDEFTEEFCFSEKYLHHRRFFLTKSTESDRNKIIRSLQDQGIDVIKVK